MKRNFFNKAAFAGTIAIATASASAPGLMAYETSWQDKKIDGEEGISTFKVDGTIFAGYEKTDEEANGVPDSGGVSGYIQGPKTGFTLSRAYVNFRGEAAQGVFKGWGFRITFDGGKLLGDSGANPAAGTNNPHTPETKFAYVQMPLYDGGSAGSGSLRIGMQNTPITDGASGSSLDAAWNHRYIDRTSLELANMGPSSDIGISFIHKAENAGIHLLLANGEGYRKNNAQNVPYLSTAAPVNTANGSAVRNNLITLSQGFSGTQASGGGASAQAADSYGLDLYGDITFKPTGKTRDLMIDLHFPFRLQNFTGVRREEVNQLGMTFVSPASVNLIHYETSKRAKQKRTYGAELDVGTEQEDFKISGAVGGVVLIDQHATSYAFDQTGNTAVTTAPIVDTTKFINPDQDAHGRATYWYLQASYKGFGVFFRDVYGTGNNASGQMTSLPSKSYVQQLYEQTVQNSAGGTITPPNLFAQRGQNPAINLGLARFQARLAGIEYTPFPRFRIALGFQWVKSTDPNGERTRVNPFQGIAAAGNAAGVVSSPAASAETSYNAQLASIAGAQNAVTANDVSGQTRTNKQVFLRAAYDF